MGNTLNLVIKALKDNSWPKNSLRLHPFSKISQELCVWNNILSKNDKIVVPESLYKKALSLIHQNHWWTKMNNDVEDLVKTCLFCQPVTPSSQFEPLNPIHMLSKPMALFIRGPMWPISNSWIHIYCHWCLFQVPRGCSHKGHFFKSLINELESIFSRYGYPVTLKTDNGPNLVSVEMENFLCSKGIHHAKSATCWPRSNREVEHYNWTLLKLIGAIHAEGKDWQSYFNSILLDYCSTKHPTTQGAPAMLLFNRGIQNHCPLLNKTTNLSHQKKAKRNNTNSKIKSKTRYDKTMNDKFSDVKVGNRILVKQWKWNKFTTLHISEPFTVIEKKGNTVKIRDAYGNKSVRYSRCALFSERVWFFAKGAKACFSKTN